MFSAGMPSSFSVYTLFFFFCVGPPADFNGGALLFGGFLCLETPSPCGFPACLLFLMPDLFAACLDFTVDVREGAMIVNLCGCKLSRGINSWRTQLFLDAGGRWRLAEIFPSELFRTGDLRLIF
jgi:hypothetical protein